MINKNTIGDINTTTEEGELLMMAIAKITSKYKTNITPDECLRDIVDLSNEIYYTHEYKLFKNKIERKRKIEHIFKTK